MMLVVVGMMILNVVRYFSEKRTAMIMNSVVFEDDDGNNCHAMAWNGNNCYAMAWNGNNCHGMVWNGNNCHGSC